jgi:hypothetical protein
VPPFSLLQGGLGSSSAHFIDAEFSARDAIDAVGTSRTFDLGLVCRPPRETDCTNNAAEATVAFALAGDADIRRFAATLFSGELSGLEPPSSKLSVAGVASRDRPRRAEIAVLRLAGRQRAFSGAPATVPKPASAARSCSWLSNRRARFRKNRIGARRTCDEPVWLRASGVPRWSFRLSKRLPPGRYVLYARAVTRAGATEQSFTGGDRNRKAFTVRKRR